jgi:hypothetical protein
MIEQVGLQLLVGMAGAASALVATKADVTELRDFLHRYLLPDVQERPFTSRRRQNRQALKPSTQPANDT